MRRSAKVAWAICFAVMIAAGAVALFFIVRSSDELATSEPPQPAPDPQVVPNTIAPERPVRPIIVGTVGTITGTLFVDEAIRAQAGVRVLVGRPTQAIRSLALACGCERCAREQDFVDERCLEDTGALVPLLGERAPDTQPDRETLTRGDGTFKFENLPIGQYALWTMAFTRSRAGRAVTLVAGEDEVEVTAGSTTAIELEAVAEGALTGFVVSAGDRLEDEVLEADQSSDTDHPPSNTTSIPGARVVAFDLALGRSIETVSAPDGSFSIAAGGDRTYAVVVSKPGLVARTFYPASANDAVLAVLYPPSKLEVLVLREGRPAKGVRVRVDRARPEHLTSAEGRVSLASVVAGRHTVAAVLDHLAGKAVLTIRPGNAETVTIQLAPGCAIAAIVEDREGAPLQGIRVSVDAPDFYVCTTGPDGRCTIEQVERGRHRIIASSALGIPMGSVSIETCAVAAAGPTTEVRLKMKGEGALVGLIVDEATKSPIAGASIDLKESALDGEIVARSPPVAGAHHADGGGKFEIKNIPPGKYSAMISGTGYPSVSREIAIDGGREQRLDVSLRVGIHIVGRAHFATSLAIRPIRVEAQKGSTGPVFFAASAKDGSFDLIVDEPGTYRLAFSVSLAPEHIHHIQDVAVPKEGSRIALDVPLGKEELLVDLSGLPPAPVAIYLAATEVGPKQRLLDQRPGICYETVGGWTGQKDARFSLVAQGDYVVSIPSRGVSKRVHIGAGTTRVSIARGL